jgi:hypothetical protein
LADNMVKIKDGEGKGLMKPLANVTRWALRHIGILFSLLFI